MAKLFFSIWHISLIILTTIIPIGKEVFLPRIKLIAKLPFVLTTLKCHSFCFFLTLAP